MPEGLDENGNLASAPDAICTYTGRWATPLDPSPGQIEVEDIAHALANQCRFTGHTRVFYSVAEHSIHCAEIVPDELRLTALLHDASEAYLTDLARPLKHAPGLGDTYRIAERRLEECIAERFGLVYPFPPAVKEADDVLLVEEIHALLPDALREEWPVSPSSGAAPRPVGWSPRRAKAIFLLRFREFEASS